MSEALSPTDLEDLARLREELGGEFQELQPIDPGQLAAATLLRRVRSLLSACALEGDVSVREWARRLGVNHSAVNRQLRSDGDMKLGTIALLAHAMGREVAVDLPRIGAQNKQARDVRLQTNTSANAPGALTAPSRAAASQAPRMTVTLA